MEQTNIKAVEMVRQIRDRHYELLKGKSHAERIQFYHEQAQRLHARLAQKQLHEVLRPA
jgi:hypothetical protein